MKIVIDVPEKYLNSNIIDVTLITGANGTITDVNIENEYTEFQTIPKGHGDLIDRTALLYEMMMTPVAERNFSNCVECVEYVPTLIKADDEEEG